MHASRIIPLLAVLAGLLFAAASHAGVITLRRAASVAPDRAVTLADVATLEGPDAEALAGVEVLAAANLRSAPSGWARVGPSEVRAALRDHKINWGRLALVGEACAVRIAPLETPSAAVPDTETPDTARSGEVGQIVRDRLIATLVRMFDVPADSLRATFDDADAALLRQPVGARRVDVQPASNGAGRLALRVFVYDGDRIVTSATIRADVRIHASVVVLRRDVQRGQTLTAEDLSEQAMWLAPEGSPPVTSVLAAAGEVARTRLETGVMLREAHIESPIVIRRGELVTVHCLSGGVVVKTRARATADARVGELVELSLGRDRRPFTARAGGPGVAVMETSRQ